MKGLKIQFFSISTPHTLELSHIFQIFTWAAHFLILSISVHFFFSTFSSVQSLSRVWFFVTPWTAAHQPSLSITNSLSLLKLMPIELVMPSNHLTLCHPPSSCLQSFPASGSFSKSQFFTSSGQSIGVSASASVLPMNIQGWFPLGWTGLISLLANKGAQVK